jgi:hypothetical protein
MVFQRVDLSRSALPKNCKDNALSDRECTWSPSHGAVPGGDDDISDSRSDVDLDGQAPVRRSAAYVPRKKAKEMRYEIRLRSENAAIGLVRRAEHADRKSNRFCDLPPRIRRVLGPPAKTHSRKVDETLLFRADRIPGLKQVPLVP